MMTSLLQVSTIDIDFQSNGKSRLTVGMIFNFVDCCYLMKTILLITMNFTKRIKD